VAASPYVRRLRERIGHELLLLPSVTALVFDERGRVLLVDHGDTGRWVAPGGAIEPGESPADACARELWEETGLLGRPVRVVGAFGGGPEFTIRYANGDEVAYVMTVFECEVNGGELRPDGEEAVRAGWFGVDDLPAGLAPWAQLVLPAAMTNRGEASFTPTTWTPPTS
jgi:8-oxo-dGTP pyrophosphatase MutT (NUDIX family)